MAHVQPPPEPPTGADAPQGTTGPGSTCLGRTCMKWSADGELTELDFQLVLERLVAVDGALGRALAQETASPG